MKLTRSNLSELRKLERHPGLWSGVTPGFNCDPELRAYLRNGLVRHIGPGLGYEITDAGRAALEQEDAR